MKKKAKAEPVMDDDEENTLGKRFRMALYEDNQAGTDYHGIHTFVLAEQNSVDLTELPDEVKAGMTFVPVATLDGVLEAALPTAPTAPASPAAADTPAPSPAAAGVTASARR